MVLAVWAFIKWKARIHGVDLRNGLYILPIYSRRQGHNTGHILFSPGIFCKVVCEWEREVEAVVVRGLLLRAIRWFFLLTGRSDVVSLLEKAGLFISYPRHWKTSCCRAGIWSPFISTSPFSLEAPRRYDSGYCRTTAPMMIWPFSSVIRKVNESCWAVPDWLNKKRGKR